MHSPNTITEFPLPPATLAGGIVSGPDGNLWFTESIPYQFPRRGSIGRIQPASPGTITEFPLPREEVLPSDIVVGPDGNLWFSETNAATNSLAIGRLVVSSPNTITEFDVPGFQSLAGITVGADGNIWFADAYNQIGRLLARSPYTVTRFTIPAVDFLNLSAIASGPDGNLWFTERGGGSIGRILAWSPNTITEFPLPNGPAYAQGVTAGPDGNIWFTESLGSRIGRIQPTSPNTITEFPLLPRSSVYAITTGADGNLWFTEDGGFGRFIADLGGKIGRLGLACGNGIVDEGEQCDDGNVTNLDGCAADCRRETHFQCYSGHVFSAKPSVPQVTFLDRYGALTAAVRWPPRLCTPTSRDGGDAAAPAQADHLQMYPIRFRDALRLVPSTTVLQIVDPFGALSVKVGRPTHLLVPTAMQVGPTPSAPTAPAVDHFTCYTVRRQSPRFFAPRTVMLEDEFGPASVSVTKPTKLCVPAGKNGAQTSAWTHVSLLICYGVQGARLRVGQVSTNSTVGPVTLSPEARRELCLPAAGNP